MKKVFFGLSVGLLAVIMCTSTAYSRDRNSHGERAHEPRRGNVATHHSSTGPTRGVLVAGTIETSPKISITLPYLDIRMDFARDKRLIWIPGYWQYVSNRRGYVWVPGHWEKRAKYYSEYRHPRYCGR